MKLHSNLDNYLFNVSRMACLNIIILLFTLIAAEKLEDENNLYKLADLYSTSLNQTNSKEPGITLFSYIDRLECGVEKSWKGNIFTESCSNLKQMGVNETGLYLLNDKGIAFCDMSREWNDSNMQTEIGKMRFKDVG